MAPDTTRPRGRIRKENPARAHGHPRNAAAARVITLNRPAALNSFTAALHGELLAALQAAAADPAVRAVVVTGAGRGFCAGQDLGDPAMTGSVDVGAP